MFIRKTESRFLLLLGSLICLSIVGLITLNQAHNNQAKRLLEDKALEKEYILKQMIELKGEPIKSLANDYSLWDDMITFVKTGDSSWADINIVASLITYRADGAWVFSRNFESVYKIAHDEKRSLLLDTVFEHALTLSIRRQGFNHFFSAGSQGIVEVRTAPIQPSDDVDRKTTPQGFLVVAKIWDQEYIALIEQAVQGVIVVENFSTGLPHIQETYKSLKSGEVQCSYELAGSDGAPIATVHCSSETPLYGLFLNSSRYNMIYVSVFCFSLMLVMYSAVRIWVSRPLKEVMLSFQSQTPVPPDNFKAVGIEFMRIAELLNVFFAQKAMLEKEASDREVATEALKESEYLFRESQRAAFIGSYKVDFTTGVWESSEVLDQIFGINRNYNKNIQGWLDIVLPDDREMMDQYLKEEVIAKHKPFNKEYRIKRKSDGDIRWVNGLGEVNCDANGVAIAMIGTIRDLTNLKLADEERRQASDSLRDRESLLRATLEATGDGILVVDNRGKVTHCNESFCQLWRIPKSLIELGEDDKLLDYVLSQLKDPDAFVKKVKALYLSTEVSFDFLEFIDGRAFERYSRPLVRNDSIWGRVWCFRDITEKLHAERASKKLQEQLEKAERMESLGLLAGGVAHDLNNMLGPLVGYSELLLRELPKDSKSAVKAQKIGKSAEEAAIVIQDLLTLARRGRYEMHPLDFNSVVQEYLNSPSFERLIERNPHTSVTTNMSPTIGTIMGSESHLGKVVMNLITNAFEAMPTGGTLLIQSERERIDRLYCGYQNVDEGEYVVLRIKDTGHGIAEKDIPRIFEPYFSMKKMGQSGSGLGLSVVYGIVKDHKGFYDLRSEVGVGTEFMLYFPASEVLLEPVCEMHDKIVGGCETILIIDDCQDQREMAKEIIESLGYSVLTAENGHKGVELIRDQSAADLIVLDMIMEPGFDGFDTYTEILKFRPDQKAIIVSGFSATERVQGVLSLGAKAFVKKPYNIDTLARAMRSTLDSPRITPKRQESQAYQAS